jgi:hypothetical protein
MIVWLASYPRSGNTALRMLLNRVFGLETFSLYDDRTDIGENEERARIVGHRFHGGTAEAFTAEAAASAQAHYVKTHDLPPAGQDWPAIVVVRDGRSSTVSYWHYRQRFGGTAPSLAEVVAGDVMFGSWSAHVAAWLDAPLSRRLVLRFEEIATLQPGTVARVAEFLGVEPKGIPADLGFEAARRAFPEFFRGGDDSKNIAELEAACPALFEALHGPVQRRLGYPPATVQGDQAVALAAELAHALQLRRQQTADSVAAQHALRDEVAALRREIAALGGQIAALTAGAADQAMQIEGMRNSPFWKLREATIGALGAAGLRRRG